jgi:rubrerythrin
MEYRHVCNACGNTWKDGILGGPCPKCTSFDHTNDVENPYINESEEDSEEW